MSKYLAGSKLLCGWCVNYTSEEIQLFQITRQYSRSPPLAIVRTLLVQKDLSWKVYVGEHLISAESAVLMPFPERLGVASISTILSTLQSANICTGNYDEQFIDLAQRKKGKFVSSLGELVAVLETTPYSVVNREEIFMTLRHIQCEILLTEAFICSFCEKYRNTLRALVSKLCHSSYTSVHVNTRFLRTPQKKAHLIALKKAIKQRNQKLKQLRAKLDKVMNQSACVPVDDGLSADIKQVIKQQPLMEKDDFKRIFWEQQVGSMHVCWSYFMLRLYINYFGRWQQVKLLKQVYDGTRFL